MLILLEKKKGKQQLLLRPILYIIRTILVTILRLDNILRIQYKLRIIYIYYIINSSIYTHFLCLYAWLSRVHIVHISVNDV